MAYVKKIGGHVRPRIGKDGSISYYQVCIYLGKSIINGKSKANYQYFSAPTEEQAYELLEQKKAEATLHMKRFASPSMMTVSEFIHNQFLPEFVYDVLKPSTQRAYTDHAKYVDLTIGSIRLRDLTTVHLQRMFKDLMNKSPLSGNPLSYRTIQDIKRFTSVVLRCAIDLKYLYENPLDGVRLKKPSDEVPTGNHNIYTKEQMATLLKGVKDTDLELPLVLLLDSGMRRGELCGLTYDNVLWEENSIRITQNLTHGMNDKVYMVSPKTQSGIRTVTLTTYTMELLKKSYVDYKKLKLLHGADFHDTKAVIHKENGDFFLPHSLYNKFKRTIAKLGLPPIRLHAIRSTSITLAIQEGATIRAVAQRVGHLDCTVTEKVYLKCTQPMLDQAADVMEGIIRDVVNK